MLQMTGAPRAVAAGLREARVSSGDTEGRGQRTTAWAGALLEGAGSMRLCWSVALLLAAAGAAGKASSRRPRGAEVSSSSSESPVVIFFFFKGKTKNHSILGRRGKWHEVLSKQLKGE